MFLSNIDIRDDSFVTDLVVHDYRTSSVFQRHGIDYCCGGKVPLQAACELRGLNTETIKKELADAIHNIRVSNSTNFNQWSIDFLVDYIINVHHAYLTENLPDIVNTLEGFAGSHRTKFAYLPQLLEILYKLRDNLLAHIEQEEKIIFPYIKQIAHAYHSNASYAALLVRTLRKPVENMTNHEFIRKSLCWLREITENYTPAPKACIAHNVSFLKLKEFDNDLVQHIHLEGNILFPKAIAMEKEMLALK